MAQTLERIFQPAAPAADFGQRLIASPFQFYVTGEENLRVECVNSQPGVRLAIQYRFLNANGEITANIVYHTPNDNRTLTSTDHALSKGAIVNLVVNADQGSPAWGQTYVHVSLVRGYSGATIVLGTLLQGYCTRLEDLAYPGSPIESSLAGAGRLRFLTGTDPAVDNAFAETVPAGARWELLSVSATLTTIAGGVNRNVSLLLDDGAGNSYAVSYCNAPQAGGTARRWCWMPGMPIETAIAPTIVGEAGLPVPCYMLSGHRFRSLNSPVIAGDDWGAPLYLVREWLEVD